jgi:hypothetical protein
MRMVGAAAAAIAAFASPSYAADLPTYRDQGTIYQRESRTYEREYRQVELFLIVATRHETQQVAIGSMNARSRLSAGGAQRPQYADGPVEPSAKHKF